VKKTIFVIISLFLYNSVFAQNHAPVVTNVHAEQRAGKKLVNITYDVSDTDLDTLKMLVIISNDGGQTFSILPVTLSGDVGFGIFSGTNKKIVWNAGIDYPDQYGTNFQAIVIADDGKNEGKSVNDGYGDYVLVPAGEFLMGDNFNSGDLDEKPVHLVFLDAYYISKYKVTNSEYNRFIDDGGYTDSTYWTAGSYGYYVSQPVYWNDSKYKGGGIEGNENFPVVGVSWYEAMAYCKWLSKKTGKIYRLPTEAEREKAARGTDQRMYPWGNNIDGSYANYSNSGDPYVILTPVGFYDGNTHNGFPTNNNASPYGAYDMAGNVWEWCSDWHNKDYYSISPTNNPAGPSSGSFRVVRGGWWGSGPCILTTTNRYAFAPFYREYDVGFRCVREY